MGKQETLRLRRYADLFAFFNYSAYREVTAFESYLTRRMIANFEDMSAKSIGLITKNHVLWAELLSNFTEIKRVCWKPPAAVSAR